MYATSTVDAVQPASSVPASIDVAHRHRFGNFVQSDSTATYKYLFCRDGCLDASVRAGLLTEDLRDRVRAHVYAAQALSAEASGLVLEALSLIPLERQHVENMEIMLRSIRSMCDMLNYKYQIFNILS